MNVNSRNQQFELVKLTIHVQPPTNLSLRKTTPEITRISKFYTTKC